MKIQSRLLFSLSAGLAFSSCNNSKDLEPKSPNIILIMMDDMGYSDIGYFGSEIKTPNIDRLAGEGYVMTNFYNAGRCCPSRAVLMTGLYQHQVGVGDMLQKDKLPGYNNKLGNNCVTIAEVLEQNGYENFISGKWHLGHDESAWPMKRGFHKQYASNGTTGHYFGVAKGRDYIIEDTLIELPGEWIKSGNSEYKLLKNKDGSQWYATDAYTDRAIAYINELQETDSSKPFFLYLPYTTPHWPLHAWPEDIAKYKGVYDTGWDSLRKQRYDKMTKNEIINSEWQLSERNENVPEWNSLPDSIQEYYAALMEVYAAMIDNADQNIGSIIKTLENTGEIENTLILFLSDNGGCHETPHKGEKGAKPGSPESFDGYEYAWANLSNTPFKWFKHWVNEGGISTPFIAWFPSKIKHELNIENTAHIMDIMPTLLELTGSEYPEIYKDNRILPLEGQSLWPLLTSEGKYNNPETLFWEHEGNMAVRKGDFKIVSRFNYIENSAGKWELFNIKNDRTEIHNLSEEFPEILDELIMHYEKWAARCNVIPYTELRHKRNPDKYPVSKN